MHHVEAAIIPSTICITAATLIRIACASTCGSKFLKPTKCLLLPLQLLLESRSALWICQDLEAFISAAFAYAISLERLHILKATAQLMRKQRHGLRTDLFDLSRFARSCCHLLIVVQMRQGGPFDIRTVAIQLFIGELCKRTAYSNGEFWLQRVPFEAHLLKREVLVVARLTACNRAVEQVQERPQVVLTYSHVTKPKRS
jgi:hypothetical protein